MHFALDRGHQTYIHEVELVLPVDRADRLGAVNGLGTPLLLVSLEQRRDVIKEQAFQNTGWRVAAHLPQGDLIAFDDEEEGCTERTVRRDPIQCAPVAGRDDGERGRSVRRRRLGKGGERDSSCRIRRIEYVRERVVADNRFPPIADVPDGVGDGVNGVHETPPVDALRLMMAAEPAGD